MRARRLILALTVAGLASLPACPGPRTVQTAILLQVRSEAAVECISVRVLPPKGDPLVEDAPVSDWGDAFRDRVLRVAIYRGGRLEGTVAIEAVGRRANCDGPVVARQPEPLEATFETGVVSQYEVVLEVVGTDADGDGYARGEDCNDEDPNVRPGATEICGDGVDQGCRGAPDLGCPCEDAPDRACYPLGLGHPTVGVGTCAAGVQRCMGRWGPCEGAVVPAAEACDGIDTDCDGEPDPEYCPCREGETRECYTQGPPDAAGVGACLLGTQTCQGGAWGPCTGDVAPTAEQCNGVDDDCDGQTDEPSDLPRRPCPLTDGVCALAQRPCTGGGEGSCTEAVYLEASGGTYQADEQACDGLDNDCDGQIDEGCPCNPAQTAQRLCYSFGLGLDDPTLGTGTCKAGVQRCIDPGNGEPAYWEQQCSDEVVPVAEVCDGRDEDCNGVVDDVEGLGTPCTADSAVGACRNGRYVCPPSGGPLVCEPGDPVPDTVCDRVDADCDSTETPATDDRDAECGGPGSVCCDGSCRNVRSDPAHCGDCYNACPTDVGECRIPACVEGQCAFERVPDGSACSSDNDDCTLDFCAAGSCVHPPAPDGTLCNDGGGTVCQQGLCIPACAIGGEIFPDGLPNPDEPCQVCDAGADATGWSPRGDGIPCADDGNPCTSDLCQAGACAHPSVPDGTPCGSDGRCLAGRCEAGCFVDGTYYAAGDPNPANPCESCDPSRTTTAFSPRPAGTPCDDGSNCTTGDACDGLGQCSGTHRDCSATAGPCQTPRCDEALGCVADPLPAGTLCGSDGVCDDAMQCRRGCFIGGTFYADGASAPGNACRLCDPDTTRLDWTAAPAGTACDDGSACTEGDTCDGAGGCSGTPLDCSSLADACNAARCDEAAGGCVTEAAPGGTPCGGGQICDGQGGCASGCWIGGPNGSFYANGAMRPGQPCQRCDVTVSVTAWTDLPNYQACPDEGNECTEDYCFNGTCTHPPVPDGTGCTGGTCSGGTCQ
ncbi:MAG: hypothetical protein D6729_14630 [Deltaproteobacteria bacterium]|nr:MAG: hypothetical protein D6729_14630 [Deltaproteobacteria bacterium]